MTTEELLKPRFRVIADYPHMELDQHGVGDIISPYGMGFVHPDKVKESYDKYPHLFKPLAWWEEREVGDMPEYIRPLGDEVIIKPDKWFLVGEDMRWHTENPWMTKSAETCEPATESDYLTQPPAKAGE